MSFSCNTCGGVCFGDINEVKDHYRTAWHVFNSKRRANNLPPASCADFDRVASKITTKTAAQSNVPVKINQQTRVEPMRSEKLKQLNTSNVFDTHNKTIKETDEIRAQSDATLEIDENKHEIETDLDASEIHPRDLPPPIASTISIFDNKQFDTVEACVQYMIETNGFFLPDSEYITDLEGLLLYLSEKVKIGATCLYCQRRFRTGRACQDHMIQMSHCKLTYDDDIDMEEYEDFYDFSSTYEDIDSGDEEEEEVAEISATTGELHLPDGRILGHRNYRQYYKQYYRPEENRESVIALKKEELLKLSSGKGQNYDDLPTEAVIENMSDIQIHAALIKHYKLIRKQNIAEQRGQMQRLAADQQREYKSKVQAARSSATTTAKIRDYHKSVM